MKWWIGRGKKEEQKFGDKDSHRIFAVRIKNLEVLQNTIGCFLRRNR
jgi:hypothetical protein